MTARLVAHRFDAGATFRPLPKTWWRRMRHPVSGIKVVSPRSMFQPSQAPAALDWKLVRRTAMTLNLPAIGDRKERNRLKRLRRKRRG